jgi:superfamily II DNA/RNA helicase/predicted RecB family nuclease
MCDDSLFTPSPLVRLPHTYRAFFGSFAQLHSVQQEAIEPLLAGRDLLLQAATGAGKTEGVLAPCLERMIQGGRKHALLYVVPARALAIDLERRLGGIVAERLGLRLGVRTGDVKRAGGQVPDLLLTTPESLDVMLGSGNADMRRFVQRVGTVVIDEVHSFMQNYRGWQLAYLLRRVERRMGGRVQKLALSATMGDVEKVARFFSFGDDAVRICAAVQREIAPRFVQVKNDESELVPLLDDLYEAWDYRKLLLFANSRACCDRLLAILNGQGQFRGVTELHYSNLKPGERRGVERRFRRNRHGLCIATSTLELGIDIGDVDGVLLYEPPDTVAAFLQRIGRGSRRSECTEFWGICRGGEAQMQLVRFLALLRLAEKGEVEEPLSKDLLSVLVQQILSCVYEKKRVSPGALAGLFPEHGEGIGRLFDGMAMSGWLRPEKVKGLFRGGRRYVEALLERRIWGNFPPAEEEFVLQLGEEAIADLPRSVVRQLEAGDRVQLAGKRLQVLRIEEGNRRQVTARPAERLDDKELFWLGTGCRVSREVARAMRQVLREEVDLEGLGLFARPGKLLKEARRSAGRVVRLANGIEVGRGLDGLYRYWTYLGGVGNLVLQWTVERAYGEEEDFAASSDATGLSCSHWIDFQRLALPVERDSWAEWAEGHLDGLCDLFALNAYWDVLPRDMRVAEVVGFLFDGRVAEEFGRYLSEPSIIVDGDKSLLEIGEAVEVESEPLWIDAAPGVVFSLEKERERWAGRVVTVAPDAWYPRALTGTLVGGYFHHQQCQRWLRLQFVPPDLRGGEEEEAEWSMERMARGRAHEQRSLDWLRMEGEELLTVEEVDASGERRSLEERFEDTLTRLRRLIRRVEVDPGRRFVLAQGVLMRPAMLGRIEGREGVVGGVGIADLIRVSAGAEGVLLQVGDIKDSGTARYSQKWQVAFYALLMRALVEEGELPERVAVAGSGFLLLRPLPGGDAPQLHTFDLGPYLEALPQFWRNARRGLAGSPAGSDYRLQPHCVSCPNFSACYSEVLEEEEVQLLPQLTAGALEKCRLSGLATVEEVGAFLEGEAAVELFDPQQRVRLAQRAAALETQRMGLVERKSRLFPENLSTAIFLHCVEDPATGRICGVGWRGLRGDGTVVGDVIALAGKPGDADEGGGWTAGEGDGLAESAEEKMLTGEDRGLTDGIEGDALIGLVEGILREWTRGMQGGKGPHVFHFGQRSWQVLQSWAGESELAFLWAPDRLHHADLQRLLETHFAWLVPGRLTLFALGKLLGVDSQLVEPESLLHGDDATWRAQVVRLSEEEGRAATVAYLDAALNVQVEVWRWAVAQLESDWQQTRWDTELEPEAEGEAYLSFLEEERRRREEDVLELQAYPLAERVARFRALGPLHFEETALDEEGRFCYVLSGSEIGLSKFREGDFLKLAPVGSADVQQGFDVILVAYERSAERVWVHSRRGRLGLSRRLAYSLEEDLSDWTGPRLAHAVRTVFAGDRPHRLAGLFAGSGSVAGDGDGVGWVESWLREWGDTARLNEAQQRALVLPFEADLGLIEGPPGTGKTQLLGWTLIALVMRAQEDGLPMRIVVSGLTHRAIDEVLARVAGLVARFVPDFPGICFKLGRQVEEEGVEQLENPDVLAGMPYAIVGATGFGLYQLFEGRQGRFPQVFDWVVFDEASQVLVPQALLSLLYGKGRFLFYGDVKQLPPVILGDYGEEGVGVRDSVLARLLTLYGSGHSVRLDLTYRMSYELCAFPSRMWYEGALRAAPGNAGNRLTVVGDRPGDWLDRVIDPDKPVALVLVDHRGQRQRADEEVEVVTDLACRLLVEYGVKAEELALISPHRAQNSATAERLERMLAGKGVPLPLIDTVERVQGAERDVVVFAFTASDLDAIGSPFLNSPNRFNVALTRSRKKLIVVGSHAFFAAIPPAEEGLEANRCFKAFGEYCRERGWVWYAEERAGERVVEE